MSYFVAASRLCGVWVNDHSWTCLAVLFDELQFIELQSTSMNLCRSTTSCVFTTSSKNLQATLLYFNIQTDTFSTLQTNGIHYPSLSLRLQLSVSRNGRFNAAAVRVIRGGQSGTGTGFPPNSSILPCLIIPPWLSIGRLVIEWDWRLRTAAVTGLLFIPGWLWCGPWYDGIDWGWLLNCLPERSGSHPYCLAALSAEISLERVGVWATVMRI
jgi:hypothetical protein